ncbi:MAG: hypothetical protein JNK21_06660 [Rhodospirillaceae bacterium]|nr:hypothetical protein [Rhodospirillaceae bacterium]
MTTVAALAASPAYPLYQRTAAARKASADDRVYDPVLDPAVNPALQRGDIVSVAAPTEEITVTAKALGNSDYSFWDLLDLINPLQHIPGVNTLYRHLTGDTIKTPMQLIGATVIGGPIGFAAAMVDSVIEEATGTDIGGHAMALMTNEPPRPTNAPTLPDGETQLAAAREFIPDDPGAAVAAAPAVTARARNQIAAASAAASMPARNIAPQLAANSSQAPASAPPGQTPTEAEAFVKTAQVAAQANVFPSFKRTGALGGATPRQQVTNAPVTTAGQNARFMPINRAAVNTSMPVRRAGDPTAAAELRARTKFAPGPVNPGGATLAPATLAAATAAQNKTAAPVSAQEAYAYGRTATNGTAPAEMPVWFDSAMTNAIDKYKAMQQAQPQPGL